MARPRQFDPEKALDAMVHVFWAKGYSDASYDDLVSASGVGRKSLYAAFGDKHDLFLKALQRYRAHQASAILDDLDADAVSTADITAMFHSLGDLAKSPQGSMGCLMANTAASRAIEKADVRDQVNRHLASTTRRFKTALISAGIPSAQVDAKARYLNGALQGLLLLAHARADPDLIDAYVSGVTDTLL